MAVSGTLSACSPDVCHYAMPIDSGLARNFTQGLFSPAIGNLADWAGSVSPTHRFLVRYLPFSGGKEPHPMAQSFSKKRWWSIPRPPHSFCKIRQ
jgi:hypothetical protein